MNQATFQEWISRNSRTPGLLGLGVYAPGKTSLIEAFANGFVPDALEKAWRCVTETISVLQLNRFPTARFRFVYGEAVVHCERRRDGACLGIFARKNAADFPAAELERLVDEFNAIS